MRAVTHSILAVRCCAHLTINPWIAGAQNDCSAFFGWAISVIKGFMNQLLTVYGLWRENKGFQGTGGVSRGNRRFQFEPAFRDSDTGIVYQSCHADGSPATCHLLEGLPSSLAVERDGIGRITAVKSSVVAGFVREGRFYTREEAAQAVADQSSKVRWLFRH